MSTANIVDAFPRRPIEVEQSWGDRLGILGTIALGLAMFAGALWFAWLYAPGIMRDGRAWTTGIAVQGSVTGGCVDRISILPLSTCDFDITYRSPGGMAERASTEAMLFGGLDHDDKLLIKVDPQAPRAIVISWFAERITERWIVLVGVCLLFLLLGGTSIRAGFALTREYWLYRKLARHPQPVPATITATAYRDGGFKIAKEYTFELNHHGQRLTSKQQMRVLKADSRMPRDRWIYEEPFLIGDGPQALALVDDEGRGQLVRTNFRPLKLTENEKRCILAIAGLENADRSTRPRAT
jgi:hypothetical protein